MTDASDEAGRPDFSALFARLPGLHLVLDISFNIVAANDAYCKATMTVREDIVGRPLFEVFADNPSDFAADGVQKLRASLLKVLKTREPDRMRIRKYDIQSRGVGGLAARYWSPLNVPVLGPDGYVKWIIHSAEDVTELAAERHQNAQLRETIRTQAKG